jgi:hypothetical protein
MADTDQPLDVNLLQNMIHQRSVMNSLGNGGLPSPMPVSLQAPDLTVHHLHGLMPDSPITPQAQAAMSPPTPVAPTPVPKVGPIDPNSTNPAESAYRQTLMNEPMKADYHPSGARKFLGVLGGIGAGIVSPGDKVQAGIQAGDAIRDAPFNSQHQDWLQNAKNKEVQATEEAADNTATGKAATDAALVAERNSTAAKNYREVQNMRNSPDEVLADKTAEAQARLKTDTREALMVDGTTKHLVQKNGLFYDPETVSSTNPLGTRVDRSAIKDISDEGKSLKETKQSRLGPNLTQSADARRILAAGVGGKADDGSIIDQPLFDASKQYVQKLDNGEDPKGAYDDIVKTMETEQGKKLTSSQKIKLENTLHPPAVGPVMLGPPDTSGTRTVESAKPGNKIAGGSVTTSGDSQMNVPTAATRTRGEAAKTAIASGNDVINFVTKNKDKLGNVGNYWNNLMQNTPAADPTVEDFRGRVASWAAQQAAAHGFRASTVMKEFESRVGTTKNPEAIVSAIKGINDELENAVTTAGGSKVPEYTTNPKTGRLEPAK